MKNLINRLKKRGWGKKEIGRAVSIIQKAKQDKPFDARFLEKRIYWVLLVIIIAANFAISVALIPIFMVLKGALLYFVLAVMGIVFGLLFELVIRSVEHLERKHHLALAIIIPMTALANIFIISGISNSLARTLNLTNFQNPAVVAFVYSVSFVLPYIVYRFILKIEYYAKE